MGVLIMKRNKACELFQGSAYYKQFLESFLSMSVESELKPDLDKKDISYAIYFHLCKMKYAGWSHRVKFNRGLKHSLSEIFQDVIAFYLKAYLPPEKYTVELEVTKARQRPDILIKRNGKNHFILEIKTNIGYSRSSLADGDFENRRKMLAKIFEIDPGNIIYVFEEHSNVSNDFSEKYWDKKEGIPRSIRPNVPPYSFIYPLFNSDDPYYWDKNTGNLSYLKEISEDEIWNRGLVSVVTPFEDILKLIQRD